MVLKIIICTLQSHITLCTLLGCNIFSHICIFSESLYKSTVTDYFLFRKFVSFEFIPLPLFSPLSQIPSPLSLSHHISISHVPPSSPALVRSLSTIPSLSLSFYLSLQLSFLLLILFSLPIVIYLSHSHSLSHSLSHSPILSLLFHFLSEQERGHISTCIDSMHMLSGTRCKAFSFICLGEGTRSLTIS